MAEAVTESPAASPVVWPRKCDIFGVLVSPTSYAEIIGCCIAAGQRRQSATIELMPVHSLVMASTEKDYQTKINTFSAVCPDGQPVRWALNRFHKAGLTDRVYGPLLMWKLSEAAAAAGVPIYLYGSHPDVIGVLEAKLREAFPKINIVGAESPPFRPLTPEEDKAAIERINASGAGIVFLGTGCPRQEVFAYEHRESIKAVMLCVGAAFDFHAGKKKMAPPWMQKRGLEWLFRLWTEPGRLWKRYLTTNSMYLLLFAREMLGLRRTATR